jgi:3-hydroxyacyl-CoA dehydrogenase/enoyl-CoA hydratase/3-hydroxybutyryl-CoA epimerase
VGRFLIIRGTKRILQNRVPEDMPAPAEALAAICMGIRQGMDVGFQYEREAIGRLASSQACRNLVGLFLQREQARRMPEEPKPKPPAIRSIGVVGAGTMGAGIAQLAAIDGFEVVVREVNDTALAAGMERIAGLFHKAVDNRVLPDDLARQKLASIKQTTAWQGFGEVDLVVEAAVEDLQLKQELFRDLEQHTRNDTILATNTSSLLVEHIAQGLRYPERVAGLHFFNPVHKMPLVEVVRGPATAAATEAALKAWAIALGKTPVAVKDGPGFVVNRVLMPYLLEAVVMAGEGVKPDVIDKSMRRFGMPMGPLELLDQVGLDVAGHIARAMQPLLESRLAAKPEMTGAFELMAQNGWLGQKSGIGFYRYRSKKRTINHAILDVIGRAAGTNAATTMARLPVSVQMREARERLVLLMVNEAAACLGSGMAADADAIDLAMVMGTGWAPHRGGPLHYGAERGLGDVVQKLTDLAKRLGSRFEPCAKLKQLAEGGQQGLFASG